MSDPGTPSRGQEVFHGDLIAVRVETIPSPTGHAQRYEIVEHPDAVAIVALRDDPSGGEPQIALVRQSRPALGRETWELPAGLVRADEREEPQRAAERELREETGSTARTWRQLAREYPSPGFSTEAITIFLATELDSGCIHCPAIPIFLPSSGCPSVTRWSAPAPEKSRMARHCLA